MTLRYGINGLGRIGRALLRAARERPELELTAVNDLVPATELARLLARDSVRGRFPGTVLAAAPAELAASGTAAPAAGAGGLWLDGRLVPVCQEPDPARIDWGAAAVEVVVEASGRFLGRRQAAAHLDAGVAPGGAGRSAGSRRGARRVVLTANPDPADLVDVTLCRGVNDGDLDPARHLVISNGSCTTNCLALVLKVLHEAFGVRGGMATVVHSYTGNQRLLDAAHADPRRARAAAQNIIPISSTTPAALGLVLPALAGRIAGFVVRVPTPMVAMLDLAVELARPAEPELVRQAFRAAAAGPLGAVLGVAEDEPVSSDFIGDARSGVVDLPLVAAVDRLVRVVAWYDNEWGYANRLVDLLVRLASLAAATADPGRQGTALAAADAGAGRGEPPAARGRTSIEGGLPCR
jgi:glyceraldehyde 3-phosphate dehydrogenase